MQAGSISENITYIHACTAYTQTRPDIQKIKFAVDDGWMFNFNEDCGGTVRDDAYMAMCKWRIVLWSPPTYMRRRRRYDGRIEGSILLPASPHACWCCASIPSSFVLASTLARGDQCNAFTYHTNRSTSIPQQKPCFLRPIKQNVRETPVHHGM